MLNFKIYWEKKYLKHLYIWIYLASTNNIFTNLIKLDSPIDTE